MPRAKVAALKAVQLDDSLPEAHAALGSIFWLYDWDGPATEREFRRALELNPRFPDAYIGYGRYLASRGRFDEAIANLRQAQKLDPVSLEARTNLEWILLVARQYGASIEQGRGTLILNPNNSAAQAQMGLAYTQQGQFSRALPLLERAARLNPQSSGIALCLAYAYGKAGKKAEARKLLARVEERAKHHYVCAYEIATANLGLGQKSEALKWLHTAYDQKCECMVWSRAEPMNDPLRSDPWFQAMSGKLGLGS